MQSFCNITAEQQRTKSYFDRLTKAATEARKRRHALRDTFLDLPFCKHVEMPLQAVILDNRLGNMYSFDLFKRDRRKDSFFLVSGPTLYGNFGFSRCMREIAKHTPVNLINHEY